ncbi:hypothetical protein EWM64_g7560 [Hericium alpestre]|uniref:Uncharacterized protein n=1 Tax=Hericium alpestre TaxID=135208 RepID=A0A4Y9ZSI2_9AGAM|nr:hypothetical protein EWM64_g7560 [Hericium alpestre]
MFKKPLSDIKTSAPLRGSDRRKLKQRVVETFALKDSEDGNLLVPEGLQSMKITTHARDPGILYFGPDGDPLWFTIGKNSNELIPTLYTLWKRPFLIPGWISTPGLVVPILAGAQISWCPAVSPVSSMFYLTALTPGALVCITTHQDRARGPAFAVGRMAVHGAQIVSNQVTKGKAVTILHIFRDHLFMMGSKCQPPEPMPFTATSTSKDEGGATVEEVTEGVGKVALEEAGSAEEASGDGNGAAQGDREASPSEEDKLSPEEVSSILRSSLLQALQTSLSSLPPSAFPIPATTFYTSHILPARPASLTQTTPIDIKHSAFKSLTAFLKQSEKQGLLRLKESKPDVSIAAVFPTHADVASHNLHRTVGDIDNVKRKEKERAEKKEQEEEAREHSLSVVKLWKPHTISLKFFEDLQMDTSTLYTHSNVKTALNKYIAAHNLVNKQEKQYINVGSDAILAAMLSKKGASAPEFSKREELLFALLDRMQPWHRVQLGSSDPITKKGQLRPISVIVKIRQGRKACTLITGFEQFQLASDAIAEALRARCASATAVTPVPGKSAGEEIMVQGKQIKPVVDYLLGEGVPKRWIEAADLSDAKKK